jgi:DNA mismatch endonuclease (patch repair protein)
MSRNRAAGTKPEMEVRALVSRLGHRYRLNVSGLPGKPDLVFSRLRKAILVHGCFWHRHRCQAGKAACATNAEFWRQKFERNVVRDRENVRDLRKLGWSVLVVWECSTRSESSCRARLERFLGAPAGRAEVRSRRR